MGTPSARALNIWPLGYDRGNNVRARGVSWRDRHVCYLRSHHDYHYYYSQTCFSDHLSTKTTCLQQAHFLFPLKMVSH